MERERPRATERKETVLMQSLMGFYESLGEFARMALGITGRLGVGGSNPLAPTNKPNIFNVISGSRFAANRPFTDGLQFSFSCRSGIRSLSLLALTAVPPKIGQAMSERGHWSAILSPNRGKPDMNHEIPASGVGISIIFAFLRWAFPTAPKSLAWSGIAAGALILLMSVAMPQFNPSLPAVGLFLAGCLCFGGSAYLAFNPPASAKGTESSAPFNVAQAPSVNGDCNVVGNGNSISGGINCPKIAQPNPATLKFGAHTITPRADGTFELVVSTELVSQTLVKLFYVSVTGPYVIDFDFQPKMTGMFANWNGKMNDNGAKALGFTNPQPGDYAIIVHTSKLPTTQDISIRYNIEPN
jgi:hypothetical protein